jgi:hypothetical protein
MIKRDLNQIKYVPYNDNFTLKDYAENYSKTLHEKVFEIQCDNETINLVFLERHLPHIIGLHHFVDKNSNKDLLRKMHNLSGQDGFDNMIDGYITFNDLKNSRNGKLWKDKRNKRRILTMHLIPDIIRESTLYLVDGKLKGKINAKYILKSNVTNIMFALCLDEDIRLDRFGENYCCISNLIDDNMIKKKIDNNELKQIDIKRIIKKDFYSGHILEITHKKYAIPIGASNVSSLEVSVACIGQLLLEDCNFSSVFLPERGRHMIFYLYFDTKIVRFLDKINK